MTLNFISEKPQEEKKDTFVEKLATQVIKNLQVKISSIHIRYEDDVSSSFLLLLFFILYLSSIEPYFTHNFRKIFRKLETF